MFRSFKLQAAIAALAVGTVVMVVEMVPVSAGQSAGAALESQAPRGDARTPGCGAATWPYVPARCLRTADGGAVPEVRWITTQTRVGENATALYAVALD